MKELLEFIVKSVVSNPKAVKIDEGVSDEGYANLSITVAPEDMGMVIGKQGRIIKAIRDLVRVKAIKEGKRVNVELVETGNRAPRRESAPVNEVSEEAPSAVEE